MKETSGKADSAILDGLDRMYRMDYGGADSVFSAGLPEGSAGRAYFLGLNRFNRFNDLGDTASLRAADSLWTAVTDGRFRNSASRSSGDPINIDLYRGLSTLQLSYVANLRDQGVKAAHLGRKAAGQLRPLADRAEAAAALALYDYYKAALLKGLSWIPFVKADASVPLRRLEESIPRSRYLAGLLETSLLWLYYDAGRYEEGLARIEVFLSRHPGNRMYRQMRADFLFRRGAASRDTADLVRARDAHEALLKEYAAHMAAHPPPAFLPLGYLSSVGNLIKIYGKLGSSDLRRKYAGIWSSSQFRPYLSWMPASLRREVDSQSK